jgi:hypothetical protein
MVNTGSQPTPEQIAAAQAAMQREQNRQFMALSVNKEVLCQQSNGGALNQSYAVGQPLTYTISNANNGYLTGFWVRCSLTCTLATGSSAVYGRTAANPLSLIDTVVVNYGGVQHNFRPYVLKYLTQMRRASGQIQPRQIVAGQQDSYLQSYYSSYPFTNNTGANTYNFAFYVPMNWIHPQDVRGILPIQYGQTSCLVTINCAGAPFGTDPILNTFYNVSGTGHSVTVSGTISIIATYKDGQSYSQLAALQPNLSGINTIQVLQDTPLNNLASGQVYRNKVSFLTQIPWLLVTVVDGVQSDKFALTSNLALVDATADQAGYRVFWRYGLNTNLDVREFYTDLSGKFGGWLQQDFDEGILPIVTGPIYEQASPDLLEGHHFLNTSVNGGWTDFHYGVQLNSTGSLASPGPRLESTVVMLAPPLVM